MLEWSFHHFLFRSFLIAVFFYFTLYILVLLSPNSDFSAVELSSTFLPESSVALSDAFYCLHLPGLKSRYIRSQEDRQAHSREINKAIRDLIGTQFPRWCWYGFCGPWLEEIWIQSETTLPFSDFGPFVPLFVPWVKLWVKTRQSGIYWTFLEQILDLIRSDFLYVTMCHNSAGIEGKDNYSRRIPRNILVMSQGGKGHIPLVLWLHKLHWRSYSIPASYTYDVVFMGNVGMHQIRRIMQQEIEKAFPTDRFHIGYGHHWKRVFSRSKFIMAPRGYGRNSYRMWETLQMGMIPVYIYSDFLWLPYYDSINWSSFAFITHIDDFPNTLDKLKNVSVEEVNEMREKIRSMRDSHFTADGTWQHIKAFLKYGFRGSDLRCAPYSSLNNGFPKDYDWNET